MRRGKSRTKQTKKAIYYSLKKRVLSALSDGPGPLLLLFSPPPSLLLCLSSFSYTLLFSFSFLFTILLFFLSFNTFSFFSRISIKHRKSASFLVQSKNRRALFGCSWSDGAPPLLPPASSRCVAARSARSCEADEHERGGVHRASRTTQDDTRMYARTWISVAFGWW